MYFSVVLQQAVTDLRPHHLCPSLYELAGEYSSFYNANRVLVDNISVRNRRSALCKHTLLVLELGLNLLGMVALQMI
jgi:arginyl-tRNA synthetase